MNKVFPFILILLLSACGFHLRGMVDIPSWLNNVAIISKDGDKQLPVFLKSQLEGYKIDVASEPADAKYWLVLNHVIIHQQIISIGSSTNPRQYQLTMNVEFMLQTTKGHIIKAPKQVVVNRQLTINNDRILGSNEEEAVLISEMRHDAATQIINRLARKEH